MEFLQFGPLVGQTPFHCLTSYSQHLIRHGYHIWDQVYARIPNAPLRCKAEW